MQTCDSYINSTPPAPVPAFHFLPTRSADLYAKESPKMSTDSSCRSRSVALSCKGKTIVKIEFCFGSTAVVSSLVVSSSSGGRPLTNSFTLDLGLGCNDFERSLSLLQHDSTQADESWVLGSLHCRSPSSQTLLGSCRP